MEGQQPTFAAVRDRLIPIIESHPIAISEPFVNGHLHIGVCWIGHNGMNRVTADILTAWNTSFNVVLEIAQWNLRRKTPTSGWTSIATVDGLHAYLAKDGLSSSRLLCTQDLVRPWPFEGILVAAPTRDQLLVLPMDSVNVLQAMRIMVLAGETARQNGTSPLSNQLFWFDGDEWEVIAVRHANDQIEIQPSERFMNALERITAVNLVPVAAEA